MGRREEEARNAATGQSGEGEDRRGMCNLLFPNWMVLVWIKVIRMPSLNMLSRCLVRNRWAGVFEEAGRIDPARAMEKNRRRPHAKTACWRELKDEDNF